MRKIVSLFSILFYLYFETHYTYEECPYGGYGLYIPIGLRFFLYPAAANAFFIICVYVNLEILKKWKKNFDFFIFFQMYRIVRVVQMCRFFIFIYNCLVFPSAKYKDLFFGEKSVQIYEFTYVFMYMCACMSKELNI